MRFLIVCLLRLATADQTFSPETSGYEHDDLETLAAENEFIIAWDFEKLDNFLTHGVRVPLAEYKLDAIAGSMLGFGGIVNARA